MVVDLLALARELQYSVILVKIGFNGVEARAESALTILFAVVAVKSEKEQSVGRLSH